MGAFVTKPVVEDEIYKVDTIPPPDGDDAYGAPTRVGPLTREKIAELMRGDDDAPPTSAVRAVAAPAVPSAPAVRAVAPHAAPAAVPAPTPIHVRATTEIAREPEPFIVAEHAPLSPTALTFAAPHFPIPSRSHVPAVDRAVVTAVVATIGTLAALAGGAVLFLFA